MPSKNPTYNGLKAELDKLLADLRAEDISVEDAMKSYERGMELVAELEKMLKTAENKITKLKATFD